MLACYLASKSGNGLRWQTHAYYRPNQGLHLTDTYQKSEIQNTKEAKMPGVLMSESLFL